MCVCESDGCRGGCARRGLVSGGCFFEGEAAEGGVRGVGALDKKGKGVGAF